MKSKEQENVAGKIKWRQHETILITAIAVMALAGYLWNMHRTSAEQYASPFINTHTPFNLYKNILLPDVGVGLSAYLAYLWLSLYTVPRFLFRKKVEAGTSRISISSSKNFIKERAKKMLEDFVWLLIQLGLIVFILGSIDNIATFYRHQWQFNYPGFSIFFNPDNPKSQLNLGAGFFAVASSIAFDFTSCFSITRNCNILSLLD